MTPKKTAKNDKAWQSKVQKAQKIENVKLGHPKGRERFEKAINKSLRKKPS